MSGSTIHTPRITYQDSLDRLVDYLGATVNAETLRECRRAVLAAYRELPTRHRWTYLLTHGRLLLNGPFTTGTVQYLDSAGAVPRQLTLSGAVWPSWTLYGSIRIGTVTYDVGQVINSTTVQLSPVLTPGPDGDANIPALTPFTLYRDTYTLPADFSAGDKGFMETSWGVMEQVNAGAWLHQARAAYSTSNTPRYYCFTGDPQQPGLLAMRVFPFPALDTSLDFMYARQPRALLTASYAAGTATATALATTLTGVGTTFTPAMVGSVVRVSSNALLPTGADGTNPYAEERTITAVTNATTLGVDAPFANSYSGVPYVVSDPIDITADTILDLFFRLSERFLGIQRSLKGKPNADQEANRALQIAMENDSRSYANRVAGPQGGWPQRLRDMPLDLSAYSTS